MNAIKRTQKNGRIGGVATAGQLTRFLKNILAPRNEADAVRFYVAFEKTEQLIGGTTLGLPPEDLLLKGEEDLGVGESGGGQWF